ncbi:MAG: rod shape-determining protein MreC [Patescibacteria group bacterium]
MRFIYTKAFAIFAAFLLAAVFLVFMQTRGWLDPVRVTVLNSPRSAAYLFKSVVVPVKSFFTTIYQLKKITQENARLASRVAGLERDLVLFNQQARENDALRKELGFIKNSKLQLVSCSVLSRNLFGSSDALVLNCGTADGVSEGQAIISQGYMVGKVTYAGKNSSTVLLIISSQFSSDAKVSQTSDTGIVRGSFGSGFILDQIPQTSDLRPGWLVVTAGINDKIPKNILIGEIRDLLSGSNDLFKRAAVISPIDFKNLDFVFAVK